MSPYIGQEWRHPLNPLIEQLVDKYKIWEDGEVAYVIARIGYLIYGKKDKWHKKMDFIKVLDGVSREYFRKVIDPLEDVKCTEKGEVFE